MASFAPYSGPIFQPEWVLEFFETVQRNTLDSMRWFDRSLSEIMSTEHFNVSEQVIPDIDCEKQKKFIDMMRQIDFKEPGMIRLDVVQPYLQEFFPTFDIEEFKLTKVFGISQLKEGIDIRSNDGKVTHLNLPRFFWFLLNKYYTCFPMSKDQCYQLWFFFKAYTNSFGSQIVTFNTSRRYSKAWGSSGEDKDQFTKFTRIDVGFLKVEMQITKIYLGDALTTHLLINLFSPHQMEKPYVLRAISEIAVLKDEMLTLAKMVRDDIKTVMISYARDPHHDKEHHDSDRGKTHFSIFLGSTHYAELGPKTFAIHVVYCRGILPHREQIQLTAEVLEAKYYHDGTYGWPIPESFVSPTDDYYFDYLPTTPVTDIRDDVQELIDKDSEYWHFAEMYVMPRHAMPSNPVFMNAMGEPVCTADKERDTDKQLWEFTFHTHKPTFLVYAIPRYHVVESTP